MQTKNSSLKLLAILLVISLVSSTWFLTSCDDDTPSSSSSRSSSSENTEKESKADHNDEDNEISKLVDRFIEHWNIANQKNPVSKNQFEYSKEKNYTVAKIKTESINCEFYEEDGFEVLNITSKTLPLTDKGKEKFLDQSIEVFAAYYEVAEKTASIALADFYRATDDKSSSYHSYDLSLSFKPSKKINYELRVKHKSTLDRLKDDDLSK